MKVFVVFSACIFILFFRDRFSSCLEMRPGLWIICTVFTERRVDMLTGVCQSIGGVLGWGDR